MKSTQSEICSQTGYFLLYIFMYIILYYTRILWYNIHYKYNSKLLERQHEYQLKGEYS